MISCYWSEPTFFSSSSYRTYLAKKSILDLLRDKQMSSILQGINKGGKPPWARRDAFALTETRASREKTNS